MLGRFRGCGEGEYGGVGGWLGVGRSGEGGEVVGRRDRALLVMGPPKW